MSSRRQFYLFFFFLFHLFFQWVTVGLCPCPVRRTVRASKAVKRVTSSVTYRYRPCFPPSSSAVTPPTSSPTSSVYFSHLFSLRESPTFSSISSDNSFEPLDAFTWNAHQVLSLHGSRKWAARTFFVDRLLPHHRATFVYLTRSCYYYMKFRAIYFWDDGTDFNVELWAACSKFIEPSVLFHCSIKTLERSTTIGTMYQVKHATRVAE